MAKVNSFVLVTVNTSSGSAIDVPSFDNTGSKVIVSPLNKSFAIGAGIFIEIA